MDRRHGGVHACNLGWEPKHGIVFVSFIRDVIGEDPHVCFDKLVMNDAEESLQDGSHLFSTQHPLAPTSVSFVSPLGFSNSMIYQ
jgi:hypothetical protein